jgi:drug/metabolite transporter (DMT)-like permease
MLFELIVGAFSAWWLANEAITLQEWVGGVLILTAAVIAILREENTS